MQVWRTLVKIALVVVVIEGALRRWVLPEASEAIYFLKDFVLLAAYIFYGVAKRRKITGTKSSTLLLWLLISAFMVLVQIINPLLDSVLVGLLGSKSYLFYVPLCFLVEDLFDSADELRRFLRWYLLLCIPVCLLGIAQFFSPADSPLNIYAPSAVQVDAATFGEEGNVRVTGTFPYIVGFSVYLTVCLALLIALLVHQQKRTWFLASMVQLTLITINLFMTGARAALLSAIVLVIGFTIFSLFERSPQGRRLTVVLLLSMVGATALTIKTFPTAVAAFMDRAEGAGDDLQGRLLSGYTEPLSALNEGHMWGYGAGATQVACYALRERLQIGPPKAYPPPSEMEPLRVTLEIGFLGFVAWYGLRIYFLYLLWRTARHVRTPMLRHLAVAACLIHVLLLPGQLVTNTTFAVFYWFLAGFAFLLPALDRQLLSAQKPPPKRPARVLDERRRATALVTDRETAAGARIVGRGGEPGPLSSHNAVGLPRRRPGA